jgi:hypothetical protein
MTSANWRTWARQLPVWQPAPPRGELAAYVSSRIMRAHNLPRQLWQTQNPTDAARAAWWKARESSLLGGL